MPSSPPTTEFLSDSAQADVSEQELAEVRQQLGIEGTKIHSSLSVQEFKISAQIKQRLHMRVALPLFL